MQLFCLHVCHTSLFRAAGPGIGRHFRFIIYIRQGMQLSAGPLLLLPIISFYASTFLLLTPWGLPRTVARSWNLWTLLLSVSSPSSLLPSRSRRQIVVTTYSYNMSSPSTLKALARWARLKKYRIEVTYGVYVFTPMEKFAFWTIFLFLFTVISFTVAVYAQRNALLLLKYAFVHVIGEDGAIGVVSSYLPKSHTALSVAGSGMTSLAESMGSAANSQAP
ncbi:hypothetical protein F4804DRAFT_310825 [Jackrogersella minutella]|nr:hypothetical protein F4804DRAFT_310825 [Jackrogersella minutella]